MEQVQHCSHCNSWTPQEGQERMESEFGTCCDKESPKAGKTDVWSFDVCPRWQAIRLQK